MHKSFYLFWGKRVFDIIFSALFLVSAFPVLYAIIGIMIKIDTPGPVLFRQTRIGRGGKPFTILKFRTWTEGENNRLTRTGRVLHRFSLNELPQFWNIFKGEMSVVGPRPLLAFFYQERAPGDGLDYELREEMIPGLTGLAQISKFRGAQIGDAEKLREMLALDIEYGRRITFGRDAAIIAKTFLLLFRPNID